ncbi:hypothetical protein GOP47_0009392 [Adiantum capillus-veneris]|uniref:Uncharacterized protein n=1 Tax=Adiantum capillus-veneris TaxID=13818 RepID=A0A9D4UWL5_ADICA|nr:hypothetical protein GOP47_0009392 [Adiantum capillus-veneris]
MEGLSAARYELPLSFFVLVRMYRMKQLRQGFCISENLWSFGPRIECIMQQVFASLRIEGEDLSSLKIGYCD